MMEDNQVCLHVLSFCKGQSVLWFTCIERYWSFLLTSFISLYRVSRCLVLLVLFMVGWIKPTHHCSSACFTDIEHLWMGVSTMVEPIIFMLNRFAESRGWREGSWCWWSLFPVLPSRWILPLLFLPTCGVLCDYICFIVRDSEAQMIREVPASEKKCYIVQLMFFSALCCLGKHQRHRLLWVSRRLNK